MFLLMNFSPSRYVIFDLILQFAYNYSQPYVSSPTYHKWIVPDFGGRFLNMDSNFGRYCKIFITIINVRTYRNPSKADTQHYLRKRWSTTESFYLKHFYLKSYWYCKMHQLFLLLLNLFQNRLNKKTIFLLKVCIFQYFTILYFTFIFYV